MNNIVKLIYDEKTKLSPREVFQSDEFKRSMTEAMHTALRNVPRKVNLKFTSDPEITAFTEGRNITVSLASKLFSDMPAIYDQYVGIIGLIVHECGHVLFTDFGVWNEMFFRFNKPSEFRWYQKPQHKNADTLENLIRTNDKAAEYISQIYHDLTNIFEDQYIEYRCKKMFGGLYSDSLVKANEISYKLSQSVQEVFKESSPKELPGQAFYVCYVQAMQQWTKKLKDDGTLLSPEGQSAFQRTQDFWDEIQPYLAVLKTDGNGIKRVRAMNEIICCFYDLLPENNQNNSDNSSKEKGNEENNQDNKQDQENTDNSDNSQNGKQKSGSSDNGNNDSSGKEQKKTDGSETDKYENAGNDQSDSKADIDYQNLIEAIKNAKNHAQMSIEPEGYSSPINMTDIHIPDNVGKMINSIMDNIAERKVESKIDTKIENALQSQMKDPVCIKRNFNKDSTNYMLYKDEIAGISAKTVNRLMRVLTERKNNASGGYYLSGKFSAKGWVKASTHENMNMFSRKRHPGKKPDVAFVLRIDQSGSMSGAKLNNAIKTALILDEVFSRMNVPYLIYGDNASRSAVNINVYHRFDDIMDNSRYAIAQADALGGTPEPIGLKFGFDELKKREEKHKVLISITDGLPTVSSQLYSEEPILDSIFMVKAFRQKGITIFGAMVEGSEERVINAIYGDQTLDLTDLNKLAVTLASLCARYILK